MSDLNLIKPKRIQNIIDRFCYTIGMLPSSYKLSLTYEEQLIAIGKYLEETVIPALNNNAEAVVQIQELFVDLKNYVDNYFDNLDVQNEIDTKLDSMIHDGTFDTIINQRLFSEINQKIDENDLKITDNDLKITDLENINNFKDNQSTIVIGDSYAIGITSGGTISGWPVKLKKLLNLNDNEFFVGAEGGSGFIAKGNLNHTFLNLLQNLNIPDKTLVKRIIVCGGYNDWNLVDDLGTLNSKISEFITYAKNNFQNSKVYLGMISNSSAFTSEGANIRIALKNQVLRSYQNCVVYGGLYLNGIQNVLNFYDFMSADTIHPNQTGYDYLGAYIFNSLINGYADCVMETSNNQLVNSDISTTNYFRSSLENDFITISATSQNIGFKTAFNASNLITLGTIKLRNYRPSNFSNKIQVPFYIQTENPQQFYGGIGNLVFELDGTLKLEPWILKNDGTPFPTISNARIIHIDKFCVSIPTKYC